MSSLIPLDWKPLKQEAKRLAQELVVIYRAATSDWHAENRQRCWPASRCPEWYELALAQERLLSDLSRPESRDLWARRLGDNREWVIAQNEKRGIGGYADTLDELREDPAALLRELMETYHA